MTSSEFYHILLHESDQIKKEHQVELDRVLLRFYHQPGLLTHLKDVKLTEDTAEIEFAFLSKEAVSLVTPLIGPVQVEAFSYIKGGEPYHGFRFSVKDLAEYYQKIEPQKAA